MQQLVVRAPHHAKAARAEALEQAVAPEHESATAKGSAEHPGAGGVGGPVHEGGRGLTRRSRGSPPEGASLPGAEDKTH